MTTPDLTDPPDRNPTTHRAHVCVVAHRLPLAHVEDEGWQRAPGGLVSAIQAALDASGGRWFGHVLVGEPEPPRHLGRARLAALEIGEQVARDAIDGCCNRTLWPALHGMDGNIEESDEWWDAYFALGDRTATEIARRAPSGALIWVHDYHHFAIAAELKRIRRDLRVGLFCHTPVVGSSLSSLTHSRTLFERMSQFDVIGTQTERDAAELVSAMKRSGVGTSCLIRTIPVGIDVDTWTAFRTDPEVAAIARGYTGADGLLAVGVDRADYTKGLIAKLLAVEVALGSGSIGPDDLRLVQIATATRPGIAAYDHVLRETYAIAARINHTFGRSDGRCVVEIIPVQQSQRKVAGLMRAADVMLITPVRDGMNLVALESSTVNADRPVEMILGMDSGAASHIGECCRLVAGADVLSIVDELTAVVTQPRDEAELLARSAKRAAAASRLTATRWANSFMSLLETVEPPHPILDVRGSKRLDPDDQSSASTRR